MIDDERVHADVFWKMYQENTTHARHHETQRSAVANLILILSGALVGAIQFDKHLDKLDLPIAVLLIALGIFGFGFSRKQYERYQLHTRRARQYRDALDSLLPDTPSSAQRNLTQAGSEKDSPTKPLKILKLLADSEHKQSREGTDVLSGRLHSWWSALYVFIIALGLVLAWFAAFHPVGAPS